jgi:hypothetical protein
MYVLFQGTVGEQASLVPGKRRDQLRGESVGAAAYGVAVAVVTW